MKTIRVFISSTFRDMQEERDLLVKKVFPDLRRICDGLFISFTKVELPAGLLRQAAATEPVRGRFWKEAERGMSLQTIKDRNSRKVDL